MRRHASSLLALLLVLPLAYASAAPAPQRGGTLTYALRDEPDRLDPNLSGLRPSQIVFFQIFDPLIVRDKKDKKFKPWLATNWSVSGDGKVYTFKLRSGVKFHDATAFDAAAVKFNFDRTHDPKLASRCGGLAGGFFHHPGEVGGPKGESYFKHTRGPFLSPAPVY